MPESTDIIYSKLFSIQFIHAGYETPVENFFSQGISITADSSTQKIFSGYDLGYRFDDNVLTCFMRTSLVSPPAAQPRQPFVTIDKPFQLRFLVHNSGDFLSKTYVTAAGTKKVYRFSNQVNNTSGASLFLTTGVAAFAGGNDYDAGTIVQDGGNLYACLLPAPASAGIAISNTTYWKQLQAVEQVVNNADLQDATTVNAEQTCMAVIDIFNTGTTNNSYRLFDGSNQLFNPAPLYTVQFKSRM
ncbi:MAG: hypothetical protein QM726_08560 [Chitinophagaceae bacterium]